MLVALTVSVNVTVIVTVIVNVNTTVTLDMIIAKAWHSCEPILSHFCSGKTLHPYSGAMSRGSQKFDPWDCSTSWPTSGFLSYLSPAVLSTRSRTERKNPKLQTHIPPPAPPSVPSPTSWHPRKFGERRKIKRVKVFPLPLSFLDF